MAGTPNVRLSLSNRAENVLLVRQALTGLAEAVGLDPIALNDVSTAVTEACNNVVLHAYSGGEGPFEVELTTSSSGLDAMVRDHGSGILPGVTATEEVTGGIGLPVIQALSDSVEFRDVPGGGTEVAMHFEAAFTDPLEECESDDGAELAAIDHTTPGDVTLMTVGPTSVARGVVPRVLSTLAARAYFSTDRISDTQLVADALVAHTDGSMSAGHLSVGVSVAPRHLEIRIGPLQTGRAGALFGDTAMDGLGPVLERLTDGHEVSAAGSAEMLDVKLAQRS
ncbi:MAG: serine/threonine-protein kinase RsbW [Solirubrobacteraceae bacterium]|nr:putative anti-sigma regulatory factor, serine/threonine protein kinase [Solirubrobacterales bacterium]MEA2217295.1 serine/threonine-protein kinase RsbW [Solirubrobacteraceae bacterium]